MQSGRQTEDPCRQEENLQAKVTRYEEFVNERLRVDLDHVLRAREAVHEETAEYLQLQQMLDNIGEDAKAMVDLGANFYARAKIPDASRVMICVGLGYYVEFTRNEAKIFIAKKVDHLNIKGKQLTEQGTEINARIQLVLEGLRELQFTETPTEPPRRTVW